MSYSVGQISTGSSGGAATSSTINYNNGSAAVSGDYYLFFFAIDGSETQLENASSQHITNDGWEQIAAVDEGSVTLFCYGKILNATDTSFTVYHTSEYTRYCMFRIASGGHVIASHPPNLILADSSTGSGTNAYFPSRRGKSGQGIAFQAVAVDRREVTGHTGGADYTSALYAGGAGSNDVGMGVLYDTDVAYSPPLAQGNFTHSSDGWSACCVLFEAPYEKLYPNTDETITWKASSGSDHYALIDEDEGSYSSSDYVYYDTTGEETNDQEYGTTNPTFTGEALNLEMCFVPYKSNSQSWDFGLRLSSGSVSGYFLHTGAKTNDDWVYAVVESTWTKSELDSLIMAHHFDGWTTGETYQLRAYYVRAYYDPDGGGGGSYNKAVNSVVTYSEINGISTASFSEFNGVP